MKLKHLFFLIALLAVASLWSCNSDQSKTHSETAYSVVCLWDQVPVREEPQKAGKWLSSLNLGETAEDLQENAVDEADNNRNYYKIKLSDGTIGWAPDYGLVKGKAAAITTATILNRRPDLLTATNAELSILDFVVITETQDDWVEVIGEKKQKKGWISAENLTTNREEIAIAVLARKNVFNQNALDYNKLETFLTSTPFTKTAFYEYLLDELESYQQSQRQKSQYLHLEEDQDDDEEDDLAEGC